MSDEKKTTAKIFTNDGTVVEFFRRYGEMTESKSEICLDYDGYEKIILPKAQISSETLSEPEAKKVYYFTAKDGPGFSADTLRREAKRSLYKRDFSAEYY